MVIGLVKGWIALYSRGRAEDKPKMARKPFYIKNTLFSFRSGILKISIEPKKRYLVPRRFTQSARGSLAPYLDRLMQCRNCSLMIEIWGAVSPERTQRNYIFTILE